MSKNYPLYFDARYLHEEHQGDTNAMEAELLKLTKVNLEVSCLHKSAACTNRCCVQIKDVLPLMVEIEKEVVDKHCNAFSIKCKCCYAQ